MKKLFIILSFLICLISCSNTEPEIINDSQYNVTGIWKIETNQKNTIKEIALYNNSYEYSFYYDCQNEIDRKECLINKKHIYTLNLSLDEFINYYNHNEIYMTNYYIYHNEYNDYIKHIDTILYTNKYIGNISYNYSKPIPSGPWGSGYATYKEEIDIIKYSIKNDILTLYLLFDNLKYTYQFKILEYKDKIDYNKGKIPDYIYLECIKSEYIDNLNIDIGMIFKLTYIGYEIINYYMYPSYIILE